ncbi:hypothetical protein [Aphanothece sacrum]|nr:hypothetical protein [Aphanothece sacrum]
MMQYGMQQVIRDRLIGLTLDWQLLLVVYLLKEDRKWDHHINS